MRILYIPLEFLNWQDASHSPYPANLGFEEGFSANGVDFVTVPALHNVAELWLDHIRQFCAGQEFDQVWFEIVHTTYPDTFLEWVRELAPVRIGLMWESCEMHPLEHINNPKGVARRKANVSKNLSCVTHLVACDEKDVEKFNLQGAFPCKWLYEAGLLPSRFIQDVVPEPTDREALFYGTLYGNRKAYLDHPSLKGILVRPDTSPEYATTLPPQYNELHAVAVAILKDTPGAAEQVFSLYMEKLRWLRRIGFQYWLDGLKEGCAVVNLPMFAKVFSGRIWEGMAAGRPVITWEIPDRPRTAQLFEPDREILLFRQDDPDTLAEHILRIRREPRFGKTLAEAALKKLKAGCTIEELVRQIIKWTEGKTLIFPGARTQYEACPTAPSIKRFGLVFDIGASLGDKTQQFLDDGADCVVAVEPQPEIFQRLKQRFADNPRVKIVGKALASKAQMVNMFVCSQAPTISTCSKDGKGGRFSKYTWDREIQVEATTLDALIQEFGTPNYCKIDVEGFELQVLFGLKSPIPLISFEFTHEFISTARKCTDYLYRIGNFEYNFTIGENSNYYLSSWCSSSDLFTKLSGHDDPLLWGDIYARQILPAEKPKEVSQEGPLRLHLGCGEQYLEGYLNIDFLPSEHSIMKVKADKYADITTLDFPSESVDEIRLHHVFEHFNRVQALVLLIRWREWLKLGGKLIIETPDLEGTARIILSDIPWATKSAAIRHLAGDQSDSWAFHVDHWTPERFTHTLEKFGFVQIQTFATNWPHPPHLANVTATAIKANHSDRAEQIKAAEELLAESMVSQTEKETFNVWRKKLHDLLMASPSLTPGNCSYVSTLADARWGDELSRDEIQNFNQRNRDRWVAAKAATVPAGALVLDVGAGTCPYRSLFFHCVYKTHDFKKYEGEKLGGRAAYGEIDFVSDITTLPISTNSFDVVICTGVLEHVPNPIEALKEMGRVLKPGGRLLLTAPLGSGLHQLPYHFYGGFSPGWYRHFAPKFGLDVLEITPNGGFYKLFAQESIRAASLIAQNFAGCDVPENLLSLLRETLPRLLFQFEERHFNDQFTIGYHVELQKTGLMTEKINGQENSPLSVISCSSLQNASTALGRKSGVVLVFSKDRPMQLEATLRSLYEHCSDLNRFDVKAIFKSSSDIYRKGYSLVQKETRSPVVWIPERDFRCDVLNSIAGYDYVLFLVDDTMFVRDFLLEEVTGKLEANPLSLGFSLRLGMNTISCYSLAKDQALPAFTDAGSEALKFDWRTGQLDFNYPLEISSSVYRNAEILSFIDSLSFSSPNSMESIMDARKDVFAASHPYLLCYRQSVAFCIPVNKVQVVCVGNRAGNSSAFSPENLANRFLKGDRINTEWFNGYKPNACHEEMPISFVGDLSGPLVSIIVPCYNQAHFLPDCLGSVVGQTYRNWECLIVNDGSSDNTSSVAGQLMAANPGLPIRLLEKTNGGLSDARNFGIKQARGRYILPLDSDDLIHGEMLAKATSFLQQHPEISIVYTDLIHFGVVQKIIRACEYDFSKLKYGNQLNYCSLYRREVWEQIGGYNANMVYGYEDWDFWIGAGEKGFYGRRLPEVLFFYRVKEESMYTKALEHDAELKAQIILNHSSLYTEEEIARARKILV